MLLSLVLLPSLAAPLPCGLPLIGPPDPPSVPALSPRPPDAALEERDAFGDFENQRSSEHFVVKWGDERNVADDEVDFLLEAFEEAWAVEIEEMEHPAPPGTEAYLFNVYIGDTGSGAPSGYGSAGYYNTDAEGYPMVVVARETLYDLDYTAITAAHEFYHAIQGGLSTYGYSGVAAWYWEATADWASGEVYPDNDYYAIFLFGFAYLPHLPVNYFNYPDRGTLDEYHQYGAFIFPRFLSEHVADWRVVRDSWVDGGDRDPLVVLDGLLAAHGTDLVSVFPTFAAKNAVWDYQDGDTYAWMLDYYESWYGDEDQRLAAEIPEDGTGGWVNAPAETLPERFGYNVLRLEDPREGRLSVGFLGDEAGSEGSAASFGVTVVVETDGAPRYTEVALEGGAGRVAVDVPAEARAVYLAVAAWADALTDGETFGWSYDIYWEDPVEGGETADPGKDTSDPVKDGGGTCGCASADARSLPWAALGLALYGVRARVHTRTPSPSSKRRSAST